MTVIEGAIASATFSFGAPAETATPSAWLVRPARMMIATKMKKAAAEGFRPAIQ